MTREKPVPQPELITELTWIQAIHFCVRIGTTVPTFSCNVNFPQPERWSDRGVPCTLVGMGQAPVFVGCCGWTEAQARYVRRFKTIELQTTFYEPPSLAVAKRWKAEAPPEFHFCMKAWQLITHTPTSPTYRRLKSAVSPTEKDLYGSFRATEQVSLAWQRTKDIAEILHARVIVFQCPKSFLPIPENIRNLVTFFQQIDRSYHTIAWEPRGDDWHPDLIRDLCAENDLVHCVDPFQSDSVYGNCLYWRLHGKTDYRYRYTDEDLATLDAKLNVQVHLPGPHYVMFNNIHSKEDAVRLSAHVQIAR